MGELVVENLGRRYGAFDALRDISFSISSGQFVTLLGPSGCGKSTTLWSLAGLDRPTSGSITFDGQTVADAATDRFVPPEKRNFGLVFQSYAVWPHMTARQNLEYPLKLRKVSRANINRRVEEVAALVELESQLDKYPYQLSGGQQQRVALARTLVYAPRLLLLDEPLSNLDAKLRARARIWLRQLHDRLGMTTIYVTHDQQEALAMSDEIIVMQSGTILQRGRPEQIYREPAAPFVADFIGNSNLLPGTLANPENGDIALDGGGHLITGPSRHPAGTKVTIAVKPEAMRVSANDHGANAVPVQVHGSSYVGGHYETAVSIGPAQFSASTSSRLEPGPAFLSIDMVDCRVFAVSQ